MKKEKPKTKASNGVAYGEAKYPYTTVPNALRKLLKKISEGPKPMKVDGSTLKTWGLGDTNAITAQRVLKKIGMLSASSEPTQLYQDYQDKNTGAATLGRKLREIYSDLFDSVPNAEGASVEDLQNFFKVKGGGGEKAYRLMVETFRVLTEFATFTGEASVTETLRGVQQTASGTNRAVSEPSVRFDLHIHLPEGETREKYEAIIQAIADKIYNK